MMSNANLSSLDSRNVRRTRRVCAFTALLPCGLGDVVEVAMEVANENSLSVIEQVVDQFGNYSSQLKTVEAIASGAEVIVANDDHASAS